MPLRPPRRWMVCPLPTAAGDTTSATEEGIKGRPRRPRPRGTNARSIRQRCKSTPFNPQLTNQTVTPNSDGGGWCQCAAVPWPCDCAAAAAAKTRTPEALWPACPPPPPRFPTPCKPLFINDPQPTGLASPSFLHCSAALADDVRYPTLPRQAHPLLPRFSVVVWPAPSPSPLLLPSSPWSPRSVSRSPRQNLTATSRGHGRPTPRTRYVRALWAVWVVGGLGLCRAAGGVGGARGGGGREEGGGGRERKRGQGGGGGGERSQRGSLRLGVGSAGWPYAGRGELGTALPGTRGGSAGGSVWGRPFALRLLCQTPPHRHGGVRCCFFAPRHAWACGCQLPWTLVSD